MLMLTLTRLLFYFLNKSAFPEAKLWDFFIGIWFDAIAVGIWFIPFYGLSLFPNPWRNHRFFQGFLLGLFHLTNSLLIAFNLLDLEYFNYTAKRSTADLFTFISTGEDMKQLIGVFLIDFWWIIGLFVVFSYFSHKLYKKTYLKSINTYSRSNLTAKFWGKELSIFVIGAASLFIISRGGFGYRPADMLTAAQYTTIEKTALVTNTPLAIIKTIGKPAIKLKNYFSKEESHLIYNPIKTATGEHQVGKELNVFVIILESFGNEWVGKKTGGPFTPFLDSLIDQSLYFSNGFANGKKSIEALPAIMASIPSLLDKPYISSHYGANLVHGLPRVLKKMNYSSAFFHGATNGSMKFDEFAALTGFDAYFGRTEYDNEDHFDGSWGIMDEYFNPWAAKTITKELKEPFFAGLFTLSSHHPYFIPEIYKAKLPSGEYPIAQAIAYADMSLKLFFEQAQKEPWYENTLFVLCADHTPASKNPAFTNRLGVFQIPIILFDPQKRIKPAENKAIFSHIDLYPTILDLVGFKGEYYSFGNSFFDTTQPKWTINFLKGNYTLYQDNYMLDFIKSNPTGLYNTVYDPMLKQDSSQYLLETEDAFTLKIKGIIQRYNHDLIQNQLTP